MRAGVGRRRPIVGQKVIEDDDRSERPTPIVVGECSTNHVGGQPDQWPQRERLPAQCKERNGGVWHQF